MKNLKVYENFGRLDEDEGNEKNGVAESLGNLLDGLAGLLSEDRITVANYWKDLDGDLKVVLEHLKELDPEKHAKVIKYF